MVNYLPIIGYLILIGNGIAFAISSLISLYHQVKKRLAYYNEHINAYLFLCLLNFAFAIGNYFYQRQSLHIFIFILMSYIVTILILQDTELKFCNQKIK